jgi:hypothetical protein
MKTMELQFKFEKETPGAVQFKEVDEAGLKIEQKDSVIGTLYVRKAALDHGTLPAGCSLTLRI